MFSPSGAASRRKSNGFGSPKHLCTVDDPVQSEDGTCVRTSTPTSATTAASFEFLMSPREQNGKRFLNGYLHHRVAMAGGFLKSWKRKYFRLREHGLLCFKTQDDSSPLFEIRFRATSRLIVDAPSVHVMSVGQANEDASREASPRAVHVEVGKKGKVSSSSLGLTLQAVEIVGHQVPSHRVEVPVYLRAENGEEFARWVACLRLKICAYQRNAKENDEPNHDDNDPSEKEPNACENSTSELSPPEAYHRRRSAEEWNNLHLHEEGDHHDSRNAGAHSSSRGGLTSVVTPASSTSRLLFSGTQNQAPELVTFRDKFVLLKEIGEGSFSIVHKAVSRVNGRLHAVKCCRLSTVLEEEVSILRSLNHPNVISLEGVYKQDDMFYVVMDYMGDGDLCDLLIRRQRLSESEAKAIIYQVLLGLDSLHRRCVIHRDIKPENIFLHKNLIKIGDFGLAKQLPTPTSMLKRSCGTLEYAAPELLCGRAYGLKSDVFSLGVVLYVLLFGAFPFSVESAAALQRMDRFSQMIDVRDMSCLSTKNEQWKTVSYDAQDIILRMLEQDENLRFSTAQLLEHAWFTTSSIDDAQDHQISLSHVEKDDATRVNECNDQGFDDLMSRGLEVTKYGNKTNTAPHETTLVVDILNQCISWSARANALIFARSSGQSTKCSPGDSPSTPVNERRTIQFNEVEEVRLGHGTDAYLHARGHYIPKPDLCFSIVCSRRSLDLEVHSQCQREFIVAGLMRHLHHAKLVPQASALES